MNDYKEWKKVISKPSIDMAAVKVLLLQNYAPFREWHENYIKGFIQDICSKNFKSLEDCLAYRGPAGIPAMMMWGVRVNQPSRPWISRYSLRNVVADDLPSFRVDFSRRGKVPDAHESERDSVHLVKIDFSAGLNELKAELSDAWQKFRKTSKAPISTSRRPYEPRSVDIELIQFYPRIGKEHSEQVQEIYERAHKKKHDGTLKFETTLINTASKRYRDIVKFIDPNRLTHNFH